MNRTIATTIVMLALLIMAGVPATVEASSTDQAQTDLSSLPKIEAYLDSMGIALDSVVVQQGQLNYAGPNCPGADWNCTTATKVVQVTTASSAANVFECLPSANATFPALNECLIVQSSVLDPLESAATTNSAECAPETFDVDVSGGAKTKSHVKCKIRQMSKKGNNYAMVRMRTTQSGGSPQFAKQEVEISQSSGSGTNTARITQTIQQTLDVKHSSSLVTQEQDACQYAEVVQTSDSGSSSSDIQQSQLQSENGDSSSDVTQEQNTAPCEYELAIPALGRNARAEVSQIATTGNLTSSLRQVINQDQDADGADVSQTQSNGGGGLEGNVDQVSPGATVLRSTSVQEEPQTQDANATGALTQQQFGPEFCCADQTGGSRANINTVTQSNVQTQVPGTGLGFQQTLQEGHCSMSGTGDDPEPECTVSQTYTNNDGTTEQSESGTSVSCFQGSEVDACFTGGD